VFYGMKGFVEGRSPQAIYEKYRTELWDNCKALWTIWVPAQLVNFSVVPRHLRIPFGEESSAQPAPLLGTVLVEMQAIVSRLPQSHVLPVLTFLGTRCCILFLFLPQLLACPLPGLW
jgi:hypothetical protein